MYTMVVLVSALGAIVAVSLFDRREDLLAALVIMMTLLGNYLIVDTFMR